MGNAPAFHSVLDAAGPQSIAIERLWWWMFSTTTTVFIVVLIVFGLSLIRGRRRAAAAPEVSVRALNTAVSGAVTLTVLILFALLVISVRTGRAIAAPGDGRALTIEVVGHQWWWEITYDADMPSRRVTLANEIHIPLNRPIALKVTSRDVIHSFWAPNLLGKRDLIPGYTTAVWLQADRAGVFRGQCAEFCGRQHAHMAFHVVAEPDEAFQRWLDAQRHPAPEPQTLEAQRGRDLFLATRCSGCHTIRGTSANGLLGPDLTHVGARMTVGSGTLPNERAHLRNWIADPQTPKPGNQMPANPFRDADLAALTSYLESLR
jgi:cytochrome c oxidase subunit II